MAPAREPNRRHALSHLVREIRIVFGRGVSAMPRVVSAMPLTTSERRLLRTRRCVEDVVPDDVVEYTEGYLRVRIPWVPKIMRGCVFGRS
jgi:hypothetical protein